MNRESGHSIGQRRTRVFAAVLAALLCGPVLAAPPEYRSSPGANANSPYSESVVHGNTIYLAGQLGIDRSTGQLAEGGIGPETRQAMINIRQALERAGGSMDQVVKCTVFLADIADWAAMNAEYVTFLPNKPARSAVGSIGLARDARVEIECIAAKLD